MSERIGRVGGVGGGVGVVVSAPTAREAVGGVLGRCGGVGGDVASRRNGGRGSR